MAMAMTLVRLASRPTVGCCSLLLRVEAYYDRTVVGAGNDRLETPGMGICETELLGPLTSAYIYSEKNAASCPFLTRTLCGVNKLCMYMYRYCSCWNGCLMDCLGGDLYEGSSSTCIV